MLDPKLLRERPDEVRAALGRRGDDPSVVDRWAAEDEHRRRLLGKAEDLRSKRNAVSKELGRLKGQGQDISAAQAEMRAVGDEISALEAAMAAHEEAGAGIALRLPNIPHASVPVGGPEANQVVRTWGEPFSFPFTPAPHWDLGPALGILDFERGAKISGSGFILYKGLGALLERALVNFMIHLHTTRHGYTEVFPPFLVSRDCMTGTGQLPKFEEDMYRADPDDLFLVPTAEVPVTNIHREEILEGPLPIKYCAYSPCFRREAGAAGKDTRGLLRVHQFNKVELVTFADPAVSYEMHEALTRDAEAVLQALELPYRVVLLATGDMGFASAKTYDLEVWAPGVGKWLEVSSCSNFEAFQARRASIRFRREPKAKPELVHTLNGSGLALPRTVAAILENHQQADGSVRIPEALRPYMGGLQVIGKEAGPV